MALGKTPDRSLPRLVREEALRVFALALVCPLLLLPSVIRLVESPPEYRSFPSCQHGASRIEGRVVCGSDQGDRLSQSELYLLGTRFDLNTVDAESLQMIPGIGTKLSARIVEDRSERGPYDSVQAVIRVKGIGPKLTERIERYAEVR